MNEIKTELSDSEIDQLGKVFAKPLKQHENDVPRDISERLRIARMQAIETHRVVLAHQHAAKSEKTNTAGKKQGAWWKKLLAAAPIIAAGAGVAFMQGAVSDDGENELAQTDLQILSSPVPPSALSDPAFLQYLKSQKIDVSHPGAKAPTAAH
ncbi:DUF3619 family protein [Lampropedia puyangensis]|uniref:DUF3619 family protein n=1 Tax=Lampropedia puyangensis TaxID=1330072 RepID=A0A4S8F937_9BURK|nr:DUF3619 family protein [Lampropedia puyangensis]THU02784.1 DUF3619 family protein [Lampropedia puyangensis]